jgi:hypothetical protein
MSRKNNISREKVEEAIKGSHAIVTVIAERLDCAWCTARKYIDKWESTRELYKDEKESILDIAESVIYKSISEGNTQDAKWLLATLGRDRGFSERQELVHSGEMNQKLTIEIVRVNETKNPGSV